MCIGQRREMVPLTSQITVVVSNPITLLDHYCITSRLVTLIQIYDTATVSSKFIDFSFQIFLLCFPEMSTGLTSYIVQIICVVLLWTLHQLHFSRLPLI